jgi:hypothetical protein
MFSLKSEKKKKKYILEKKITILESFIIYCLTKKLNSFHLYTCIQEQTKQNKKKLNK